MSKLHEVLNLLVNDSPLPVVRKDHALTGDWIGYRELHIEPDWLLIYQRKLDAIFAVRTGSHSDLFG